MPNDVKTLSQKFLSILCTGDVKQHLTVPDKRSRVLEVTVVRRTIIVNLGTGNLEEGGKGKG
jgi:hypothetical protein